MFQTLEILVVFFMALVSLEKNFGSFVSEPISPFHKPLSQGV